MNYAVETEQLSKRYGSLLAVDHLSIKVAEGEIYGFLGLNGAGKTTTFRMLLGMIKPTSGKATLLGAEIRRGNRHPWASLGYLVETPHAYGELTVLENLEIARRMHPGTQRTSIPQIVERLRLGTYTNQRAGNLSLGNAQRLGLAKALLHAPRLLILDEPANGLDPVGIAEIRHLLLELSRDEGVTILMSSHILSEVSRLAQRIGIVHQGRLLQELDIDDLNHNRHKRLLVRTHNLEAAYATLSGAGYCVVKAEDGMLVLNDMSAIAAPDQVATLLVDVGCPPTQLLVEEEALEQYFLRLIGVSSLEHH